MKLANAHILGLENSIKCVVKRPVFGKYPIFPVKLIKYLRSIIRVKMANLILILEQYQGIFLIDSTVSSSKPIIRPTKT